MKLQTLVIKCGKYSAKFEYIFVLRADIFTTFGSKMLFRQIYTEDADVKYDGKMACWAHVWIRRWICHAKKHYFCTKVYVINPTSVINNISLITGFSAHTLASHYRLSTLFKLNAFHAIRTIEYVPWTVDYTQTHTLCAVRQW